MRLRLLGSVAAVLSAAVVAVAEPPQLPPASLPPDATPAVVLPDSPADANPPAQPVAAQPPSKPADPPVAKREGPPAELPAVPSTPAPPPRTA
ncbi:MAG: hypothetical protein K2X82_28855, partial [Gemmataceae bacterium]|nr:hypothetical protein [Gemmataceae bacterium]